MLMTCKKIKTILFASLIVAIVIPLIVAIVIPLIVAMTIPFNSAGIVDTEIIDDELLITQYNSMFGNDSNISNEKKIKVIIAMMNAKETEISQPKNQDKVAKKVLKILEKIENTENKDEKQQLKKQLDGKSEKMLQVGLVLTKEYNKNPEYWDKELDKTSNSPERTFTELPTFTPSKKSIYIVSIKANVSELEAIFALSESDNDIDKALKYLDNNK